MNAAHKWNSINCYPQYSGNSGVNKTEPQAVDQQQNNVEKVNEYETNFLNLPKNFKIGG